MLKRNLIPDNIRINTDTQYEIAVITKIFIKTLGSVKLTFDERSYRFQVAPEEIQLNEKWRDRPRHFEGFYNP